MTDRICKKCGNKVISKHKTVVFCSQKCSNSSTGISRRKRVLLKCNNCNSEFETTPGELKYRGEIKFCSNYCQGEFSRKKSRVDINCDYCSTLFSKLKSKITNNNFCSATCHQSYQKHNPVIKSGYWYENGYKVLYMGDGKGIKEHIHIMQKHIGRPLKPNEQVHHINEIKDDNRIENLQLVTRSEHMKIHRRKDLEQGKTLFKKVPKTF